jgi:AcrR family transcriptional regulator
LKKSSTDKIIEAAQDLFWHYGIKKVTVEEISDQAGVSKMTFYRKFENKFELAKVVLEKVMTDGLEDYRNFMEREDIPFTEKNPAYHSDEN